MKKLNHHFTVAKLIVAVSLLLICIAATGQAQSAEDDYKIRVDIVGVPGEGIGGSIDAAQFSSGLQTDLSATGASIGRAKFTPAVITKGIDSASPKLHALCAGGHRLSRVQISFIRSNHRMKNGEQVFLQILLDDVQVTSINLRLPQMGGAKSQLDSGEPYEEVAFSFGRITWIYTLANGSTIREGWDLRTSRDL